VNTRRFKILFVAIGLGCWFLEHQADAQMAAQRGRPHLNAARTTFVADNGERLRGPFNSTDGEVTKVASNRQWTTYFRREFYVPNPANVTALNARLTRDDAAVIYLNGSEVWRDTNFAGGVITNQTPARIALGSPDETNWFALILPASTPNLLVPGWNLLAAEVHNQSLASSDIGFNFELTADVLVTSLPALEAVNSGGALEVVWAGDGSYFNLYSATNLAPPVAWTRATNTPVLVNGRWQVTLPPGTNSQRFFSLQKP